MRIRSWHRIFSFLIIHCSLLIVNCDLPEGDLQGKIEENVQWYNAARLSVTVAIPSGWGGGTDRCFDAVRTDEKPRQGYPFTAEFTPAGGFGFVEWLAFNSSTYTLAEIAAWNSITAKENSLKEADGVVISAPSNTNTGAIAVTVTVNAAVPVMLVPFCDTRPRLGQQTNPPLNRVMTFPYDQQVDIWFTLPVKADTAKLGESIVVFGRHIDGNNYGTPFIKTNGDLTAYFSINPTIGVTNHITLIPFSDTADELTLLDISVTVGPDIESESGVAMAAAETFSYQTNMSEMQKAYRPGIVQASRERGSGYFQDAETVWNSPSIDRRFNDKPGNNTVYIRFSVTAPEGALSLPNMITITERRVYDLYGIIPDNIDVQEYEYQTANNDKVSLDAAGYTIAHSLQTAEPGIIQLVVLPWYDDAQAPYPPLDPSIAVTEGHYATVVLDNAAPVGNLTELGLEISGGSEDNSLYTFSTDVPMTFTLDNLENLSDNGSRSGILHTSSRAYDKPWTMDMKENLQWRVSAGDTVIFDWHGTQTKFFTANVPALPQPVDFYVSFRDALGNESRTPVGMIKTIVGAPVPIEDLVAEVNADGDKITVTWQTVQNPPDNNMIGANVSVNEGLPTAVPVPNTGTGNSIDIDITTINDFDVTKGQWVSGIRKYEIKVTGYNDAGEAAPLELSIWNIPGMYVTPTNTVVLDNSMDIDAAYTNYVLTSDITLDNWNPVDLNSKSFYGNGHTITIDGMSSAANMGLFGSVQGAEIRDLRVEYNMTASGTGNLNFGGIAGQAAGTTVIRNVIVGGTITVDHEGTDTVTMGGLFGSVANSTINNCEYFDGVVHLKRNVSVGPSNIGGFSGLVESTTLNNCGSRGLVKIDYGTTATTNLDIIQAGGFVGFMQGGVTGCYSNTSLEVNINSTGTGTRQSIGGFGGVMQGLTGNNTIKQCYATGSITVISTEDDSFPYFVGGFTGPIEGGIIFEDCYATGNVMVDRSDTTGGGDTHVGGFGSRIETSGGTINRCFSTGSVTGNSSRQDGGSAGGLVGDIMSSSGIVRNSIVLGSSVTGTKGVGGSNLNIGRISANSNGTMANNYAVDTLKVWRKEGTGDFTPEPIDGDKDGAAIQQVLLTSTFWRGLDYSDTVWDMGTPVTRNGYPTLRDVGGAQ